MLKNISKNNLSIAHGFFQNDLFSGDILIDFLKITKREKRNLINYFALNAKSSFLFIFKLIGWETIPDFTFALHNWPSKIMKIKKLYPFFNDTLLKSFIKLTNSEIISLNRNSLERALLLVSNNGIFYKRNTRQMISLYRNFIIGFLGNFSSLSCSNVYNIFSYSSFFMLEILGCYFRKIISKSELSIKNHMLSNYKPSSLKYLSYYFLLINLQFVDTFESNQKILYWKKIRFLEHFRFFSSQQNSHPLIKLNKKKVQTFIY